MANGFAVAERRGDLTTANSMAAIAAIEQLLAQSIENSVDFISLRQVLLPHATFSLLPTTLFTSTPPAASGYPLQHWIDVCSQLLNWLK